MEDAPLHRQNDRKCTGEHLKESNYLSGGTPGMSLKSMESRQVQSSLGFPASATKSTSVIIPPASSEKG